MRRELKAPALPGGGGVMKSFSSCPDEEGTERRARVRLMVNRAVVSAVVPMRRELKGITGKRVEQANSQFQQLSR